MTQDQLLLLKRIMQMDATELEELRKKFMMYEDAVELINQVVGRPNRIDAADCLQKMNDHHKTMEKMVW